MEIRGIRPEEYAQAENMMSLCFRFEDYKEPMDETGHKYEEIYGAFTESGEMTSCVIGNRYTAYYWGHPVGMCGIGGVCTLPEHRHGGGIRSVLTLALEEAYERGDVIGSLYPFSHRFYRKFGFETGAPREISSVYNGGFEGFEVTGHARRYQPGTQQDRILIEKLYETFAARHNYAVQRTVQMWDERLEKDPYRTHTYTYIWEKPDGEAEGYVTVLHEELPDDRGFTVTEWIYTTPAAMKGLMGFLKQLSPSGSKRIRIPCTGDVPAAQLFPESVLVSTETIPQGMVRIINVCRALELYPWEEGTAFSISVKDTTLPRNTGNYRVERKGEKTTITLLPAEEQSAQPDISCSIQTLSLLLSGIMDLRTAAICREDLHLSASAGLPTFPIRAMYLREMF